MYHLFDSAWYVVSDSKPVLSLIISLTDIINIIAVTIFGVEHRFNDGYTYGQAFWMSVCSTVASTFTNFTLIIDLVRTPNFKNSGEIEKCLIYKIC